MGAGHVTMPQLHGPMGFCVLQWCHPMLACIKRTSYCTRIITLYGARKVDSGPCNLHQFLHCHPHCLQLQVLPFLFFFSSQVARILHLCHHHQNPAVQIGPMFLAKLLDCSIFHPLVHLFCFQCLPVIYDFLD